jgi:WD40 repeat protein
VVRLQQQRIAESQALGREGGTLVSQGILTGTNRLGAASGRLLKKLDGHTDAVYTAALSPDGQRVASYDRPARLWNAANGQVLAKLKGHTDSVKSASFSPDGQRVVTASGDHAARLWNAASGKLSTTLEGHAGALF